MLRQLGRAIGRPHPTVQLATSDAGKPLGSSNLNIASSSNNSNSDVFPKGADFVTINSTQPPASQHLVATRDAGYTHLVQAALPLAKVANRELISPMFKKRLENHRDLTEKACTS